MDKFPNLNDLRLFSMVAKHASFLKAAEKAGIAQTTVSKRVAVLEEALGVKLLFRTTRTVKVTEDGIKVYQWAQKILDSVTEMHEDLSLDQGEITGPIRVSASSRLGRDYVAPALSKLKHRFPGIDVWLETMDRRVDLVGEDFHLDVRTGNAVEPNLIGHPIFRSSRVLCASPGYISRFGMPRNLSELSKHRCLLFRDRNEPFGVWQLNGPQGIEEVRVTGDLASNDNDVILRWAQDGHGIMIGADWFVSDSLEGETLTRVLPNWHQPIDVWTISTLRTNQSAKVRLFIEYLKSEMNRLAAPQRVSDLMRAAA